MINDFTLLWSDHKKCIEAVEDYLDNLACQYDRTILCFTSTPNFRHSVLPSYKGGRNTKRKPLAYWNVVNHLLESEKWETKRIPNLEADDVLGILATNPKYTREYEPHIYTSDKDLYQVPNCYVTRGNETKFITIDYANHFRYTQALTGDVTDGYKGLKGCGPKRAERLLDGLEGSNEQVYIDTVLSAYMDKESTVEEAYEQINCACILRYGEYDFKNMCPLLKGDD